jgi:streptogramin lyase
MVAIMMGLIMLMTTLGTVEAQAEGFVEHGVGAPVAESRGVIVLQDAQQRNVAVTFTTDQSAESWVLFTDLDSGECSQINFPPKVPAGAPFASLLSRNGRIYTAVGKVMAELDPTTHQWLWHGVPEPKAAHYVGQAIEDGPDGLIYAGTYPGSHLISFNPETKETIQYGQIEPKEQYFNYLAFDSTGWAYCGIGTARATIVAFNPQTRERRELIPEEQRVTGSGYVFAGEDGKVYGYVGSHWYQFFEGKAVAIEKSQAAPKAPSGALGWGQSGGTLPDGRTVKLDLPNKWVEVRDPAQGETKRWDLQYESGGAFVSSLISGPDQRVYGSTNHPMHFFRYDPSENELLDLGWVHRVGGGNFTAMATQGPYIAASSYALGIFHLFDTRRPFNFGVGDDPNPRELAEWKKDICRPRACLAYPDGQTIMMAGFAGYGLCGGGLGIYDLQTETATLIQHEDLMPDQSVISLRVLPDGNLVGGTSVLAPGGGHTTYTEGELFVMDWETKKVVWREVAVPGSAEVHDLVVGPDGLVYGLASGSQFFVFDPRTRQIVHREDLSAYGGLPRHPLAPGPDGMVYALFTKSIVKIEPGTYQHEKIATPPTSITAGTVLLDGRLYYASTSRLWSYDLGGQP